MPKGRTIKDCLVSKTVLATSFFLALATTAPGQSREFSAKFHDANEHRFMSAPQSEFAHWYVYYSVCNQSSKVSAFHWKLAGFGVGAPRELELRLCAYRKVSGPPISRGTAAQLVRLLDEQHSEVAFQGLPRAHVHTWVPCTDTPIVGNKCGSGVLDKFGRYLSELTFFASADGKNVAMEVVHISFQRNDPDDSRATLRVVSSRGIEHFAVVFPSTSLQVKELADLFKDKDRLSFSTFSAFSQGLRLNPSMLADGVGANSPVLSLHPNADKRHIDERLSMHSLQKIGEIALIGLAVHGKDVVARNDLTIPSK